MPYTAVYDSPLGQILLAADDTCLVGLWFEGQANAPRFAAKECTVSNAPPVLEDARQWLENYFSGGRPQVELPLRFTGTDFQAAVWKLLTAIPYGETTTYKALARQLADKRGSEHLSAQAVGNAVARNPISILVPCHRVVGTNGSLTGYAGGLERKAALLRLEGAMREDFFLPKARRML